MFIGLLFLFTFTPLSQAQTDTFPFIQLGAATVISLPTINDGISGPINVPGGFSIGNTYQTTVYVSTDGYFSFGRAITCCPSLTTNTKNSDYIVAPFMADTNISSGLGRVSYEVHDLSTNSSQLSRVNAFIHQQKQYTFSGNWMLVAEWSDVPQSRQANNMTNTFQGIVITNGNQSFMIFTYQCGCMQWSGNAVIGFKAGSELKQIHPLSGCSAGSIACQNAPRSIWSNVVYNLQSPYLLYLYKPSNIANVFLDGLMKRTISNSAGLVRAIDFDVRRNIMFWSDINTRCIYRGWLNATGATVLIDTGLMITESLAWDWINEKLYWTDSRLDKLEVFDPGTGNRTLLFTFDNTHPQDMVLDPMNGLMYWTVFGGAINRIERASMNGTSRTVIHGTNLMLPSGITLDYDTQTLYWVDWGYKKLEKSNADGSNRMVLTAVNIQCPFAIAVFNQRVYWGEFCQNVIFTISLNSPNNVSILVDTEITNYRFKLVSEEKQPITEEVSTATRTIAGPGTTAGPCTAGPGTTKSNQMTIGHNESPQGTPPWKIVLIILAVITSLIIMTCTAIIVLYYAKKRHSKQNRAKTKIMKKMSSNDDKRYSLDGLSFPNGIRASESGILSNHSTCANASFRASELGDNLIPSDHLTLMDKIGEGEFGAVYRAHYKISTGRQSLLRRSGYYDQVAVKIPKGLSQDILHECEWMKKFDHPNVLTLLGVCIDAGPFPYVVMPFMAHGSLKAYFKDHSSELIMTEYSSMDDIDKSHKRLGDMCFQICKGMEYLATKKVVHRDLAARNCMIDDSWVIKVADFGLSEDTSDKDYFRMIETNGVKLPLKWMALESLKEGVFSEKTDVWSFGVTMWEVFTCGESPYKNISHMAMKDFLQNGGRLESPTNTACNDNMYSMMEQCWLADPKKRPDFSQLCGSISTLLESMTDYIEVVAFEK